MKLSYRGKRTVISVPECVFADHTCKHCGGDGRAKCPRCDGTGTFRDGSKCYYCQGAGWVTCPACDGTGTVKD